MCIPTNSLFRGSQPYIGPQGTQLSLNPGSRKCCSPVTSERVGRAGPALASTASMQERPRNNPIPILSHACPLKYYISLSEELGTSPLATYSFRSHGLLDHRILSENLRYKHSWAASSPLERAILAETGVKMK